jgi:vitamin B12 transporter
MQRLAAFFLLLALFFSPAFSEKKKEKPDIEEKVEVIGKVPLSRALQSVTVLDEDRIRDFAADGLRGLLNQSPGMLVLNAGNPAQFSYSFARGASVNQMLYLVDGVRLDDPSTSLAGNFSFLSPQLIEKIEVVRGPLSNLYGSSAMGGVVNLITRKKEGLRLSLFGGSHGTVESGLHFGKRFGKFYVFSDGDLLDYDDTLVNDRFKRRGVSLHAGFEQDDYSAGLSFFASLVDAGIPWYLGKSTPNRSYAQENFLVSFPLSLHIGRQGELNWIASLHWNRYDFHDPDDLWSYFYSNDSFVAEMQAKFSMRLLEKLSLVSGVDLSSQEVENTDNEQNVIPGLRTHVFSFFIDLQADLGKLLLAGSLRFDKYDELSGVFSPQFGISHNLLPFLKFRASFSRSFRAPTIPERFNPYWGNSELLPETGRSFEAGMDVFVRSLACGLTLFDSRYANLIGFSPLTSRFANINKARIRGVEASCDWEVVKGLQWRGAYTYLYTRDIEYDRALLRRPRHTLTTSLAFAAAKFSLSGEMVYVGKRLDYDELLWSVSESKPFSHFDFMLSIPLTKNVSASCRVSNAFNTRFEEVLGYPAPLRRVALGMEYRVAD